jgi:hypothetical protein
MENRTAESNGQINVSGEPVASLKSARHIRSACHQFHRPFLISEYELIFVHHKALVFNLPTKKLTKGGVLRRALGIVSCYIEPFLPSRRIAGNGKRVFVYYNGGCAYANGCDVSAEGLDTLALVGDDPN